MDDLELEKLMARLVAEDKDAKRAVRELRRRIIDRMKAGEMLPSDPIWRAWKEVSQAGQDAENALINEKARRRELLRPASHYTKLRIVKS